MNEQAKQNLPDTDSLLVEVRSERQDVSSKAVNDLLRYGRFADGSLRGKLLTGVQWDSLALRGADLAGVDLTGAFLYEVNFEEVNLQGAKLVSVNLECAVLDKVNLQDALVEKGNLNSCLLIGDLRHASFRQADLQNAFIGYDLRYTSFEGANLTQARLLKGTNLELADFRNANLLGAVLSGVHLLSTMFNEQTILPDGTNWTPATNMARFTTEPA